MTTHIFRNPWHKPGLLHYGPEFYVTDVKPAEYRGFQIFNRFRGSWMLVKDGVCLTDRAGGGALRSLADALLGDKTDHDEWLVARARDIAERHGVALDVEA